MKAFLYNYFLFLFNFFSTNFMLKIYITCVSNTLTRRATLRLQLVHIYCQWQVNDIKAPSFSFKNIYEIHLLCIYLFIHLWNEEYFFSILMNCYQLFCFPRETSTKEPVKLTVISNIYDRGPHIGGSSSGVFNLKLNAYPLDHGSIKAK